GAGNFVVVSGSGVIARSRNGDSWERETPPQPANFRGITYGNERFVAAGNSPSLITWSTDAVDWKTALSTPATNIETLFFGNNLFLLGGEDGLVMTSFDGVNWDSRSIPSSQVINGFAFGNGIYLFTSAGGIHTSTDGFVWKKTAEISTRHC